MGNVKEINRIEALRLSCSHEELMPAWCCPKKFSPDVMLSALNILDISENGIVLHSSGFILTEDILHV